MLLFLHLGKRLVNICCDYAKSISCEMTVSSGLGLEKRNDLDTKMVGSRFFQLLFS